MVWTLIGLAASGMWFGMAAGVIEYQPWMITLAFALVGLDMLVSALKSFAKWLEN